MSLKSRACVLGLLLLAVALGVWNHWRADRPPEQTPAPDPEPTPAESITSATCRECHSAQFDSWHRTFHRTMTREATPENVKGDFANATLEYRGFTSRMTREGDSVFVTTLDPDWSELFARSGGSAERLPAPKFVKLRVDRVVGSHWLQECLHRTPSGRYVRLPVLYHIADRRWVQSNGAFLVPDRDDFWAQSRGANWNESCLYCHNTKPSKNPVRDPRGAVVGYETEVGELGIACAACHGHGERHVRKHRTPSEVVSEDVVNPNRLSVPLRDGICARCHGALVPKPAMWDPVTHEDPFVPGRSLFTFNHLFHSEAQQSELAGLKPKSAKPPPPEPTDGRFWGDGTPLTTALEYNGLALSACYQGGAGKMSCLSCHTMHGDDPNMMLKPGMQTNDACIQCHSTYAGQLEQHTRHGAGSPGSLCINCHMAPQVYSLMTTHRSHRIETPDLRGSIGTGKPHACNLCHLDKSLGWTRDQLAKWPGGKRLAAGTLTPEEESTSSAVLLLAKGDARSRVVVAGAFSNPAARLASGTDWFGSVLSRTVQHERYPAVRHLVRRALVDAGEFDPFATAGERTRQLDAIRQRFDANPVRRSLPGLPFLPSGRPDEPRIERLRNGRIDPDLTINE
jgi:predicted CXXCH cytochrome family protein